MSNIFNFTPTVLKNLFSKPVTKNYPAEPAQYPVLWRMYLLCDQFPSGAHYSESQQGIYR